MSKDGQMSLRIILLLYLTPATSRRKEPALCRVPHGVHSTGESPPVLKREKNMETYSGPDEEQNERGKHSRIQSGRKAGSEKCGETDAQHVHRSLKKLQHPKKEPL